MLNAKTKKEIVLRPPERKNGAQPILAAGGAPRETKWTKKLEKGVRNWCQDRRRKIGWWSNGLARNPNKSLGRVVEGETQGGGREKEGKSR